MSLLSYWLLIVNAAWDFLCAAFMLLNLSFGVETYIADAHFHLLQLKEDQANQATRLLFTVLVLQSGAMRAIAAHNNDMILGLVSYGTEALLIAIGTYEGVIERQNGAACFLMCLACALILVYS